MGGNQIRVTVAVEIRSRDRSGIGAGRKRGRCLAGPIAIPEKDTDVGIAVVRDCEIETIVLIEIADGQRFSEPGSGREVPVTCGLKRAVAIAKQEETLVSP